MAEKKATKAAAGAATTGTALKVHHLRRFAAMSHGGSQDRQDPRGSR